MTSLEKPARKNGLVHYLQESYQELRKVTWPTRNQAVKLTFLVLGFCLVSAVVIGALDFIFSSVHEFLLNSVPAAPIEETATSVSDVTVNTGTAETAPVTITPTSETTPSADTTTTSGSETPSTSPVGTSAQ